MGKLKNLFKKIKKDKDGARKEVKDVNRWAKKVLGESERLLAQLEKAKTPEEVDRIQKEMEKLSRQADRVEKEEQDAISLGTEIIDEEIRALNQTEKEAQKLIRMLKKPQTPKMKKEEEKLRIELMEEIKAERSF